MENKIVFLVKSDIGQWEGNQQVIEGIFEKLEDAEDLCVKIRDKMKKHLEVVCPVDESNEDNWSEEESEIYFKWWALRDNAQDFNWVKVFEYELNKIVNFKF